LLAWVLGIEPTILDLSSQSGAYDLSASGIPITCFMLNLLEKYHLTFKKKITATNVNALMSNYSAKNLWFSNGFDFFHLLITSFSIK